MPLYAVGVFLSFTLSQFGMFKRWIRLKCPGWKHRAFINGVGAIITAVTTIVIGATKFMHGAWIVCICIPTFVFVMSRIKVHYKKVAEQLKFQEENLNYHATVINHVIVPVDTLNKSFIKCLNYGKVIGDSVEIYHVCTDEEATEKLKTQMEFKGIEIPLTVENAPYRNTNATLLRHIKKLEESLNKDEIITVVMPQFMVGK